MQPRGRRRRSARQPLQAAGLVRRRQALRHEHVLRVFLCRLVSQAAGDSGHGTARRPGAWPSRGSVRRSRKSWSDQLDGVSGPVDLRGDERFGADDCDVRPPYHWPRTTAVAAVVLVEATREVHAWRRLRRKSSSRTGLPERQQRHRASGRVAPRVRRMALGTAGCSRLLRVQRQPRAGLAAVLRVLCEGRVRVDQRNGLGSPEQQYPSVPLLQKEDS